MRRSWSVGARLAVALVAGMLLTSAGVAAQDDLAASGNGGTGTGSANGGAAAVGDVMSGGNAGNAVGLGDTGGGEISGGAVANSTGGTIDVDGGTGIAAADGGEYNIAFKQTPAPNAAEDDDEEEDAEFVACLSVNDDGPVCGSGTCTGPDDALTCVFSARTCAELGLDPQCDAGEGVGGTCTRINADRVECVILD